MNDDPPSPDTEVGPNGRARGVRDAERLAHLAAVVDTSSDAILSKTLEGVITSWNTSAERMFGYTAAEAVGRNIRVLIPDELQSEEDEILEQLRADRLIEHYETVRLTKDGRRLDVSLSISPVKNEHGKIVGAAKIVRDVSARKRADEALRAATAKFESVFNQSGIFAGILDLDGNLLEVNALAVDACGYTRDEVLGRPFWETPWWRGSEETQDLIRGAARRGAFGGIFHETLRYWVADGTERIVDFALHPVRDENGVVRFLHPTGIDITERERAEERFRSLVSIVTDVPWGADAEGRFTAPQPAWQGFTGQSEEQYLGDGWLDAVHTDDRARVRADWKEATTHGALFQSTGRLWHELSGQYRHVVARATPLGRAGGSAGEWVGACTDVHERTVAEEALRAREAEEREIAIGLQRALLPGRLATLPQLAFAARYEAGSDVLEVGGDWYDAFALPDGRVGLTVGDVVGHGLAAAAAMGQLRTALAALAQHAAGPGELLTRLEGFLLRSGTTDFATVCYAVLDPATGVLDYASAGHPPILLVTASGETHLLDAAQSAPLTGLDEHARPQASVVLEPGSLLVLYSDGLVERRGERFSTGLRRLRQAGESIGAVPLDQFCDDLVVALGVAASRDDDVVVLAVRFAGAEDWSYRRTFPARAEELRSLRASMRRWLDERAVGEPARSGLLLAVGEACANAIEHAYRDGVDGAVEVDVAETADRTLLVRVSDSGTFREPEDRGDERGRGTDIMRSLTDDFSRESTSAGTTVRFRLPMDAVPART